jgi:hypothetical protein
MYNGLHIKYPLFLTDFNEFSQQIFDNTQVPNFMKTRLVTAEMFYAVGRTDGHDETKSLSATWRKRLKTEKITPCDLN